MTKKCVCPDEICQSVILGGTCSTTAELKALRHACLAALGWIGGVGICTKEQIQKTLADAVRPYVTGKPLLAEAELASKEIAARTAEQIAAAMGVQRSVGEMADQRISAWPPDCAFASPEDPRWETLGNNPAAVKPDWRIGLTCKPKFRSHDRYYEGPFKIVAVEPSGTGGIVDDDGVLRIDDGGFNFLAPASEWVTA